MKRYRAPKAKPGELKAQWGKLKHDNPDLCYAWGEGVPSCDGRLLHHALTSKHHFPVGDSWEPGFLEELEKRGYDLTTLKFSIQKKPCFQDVSKPQNTQELNNKNEQLQESPS